MFVLWKGCIWCINAWNGPSEKEVTGEENPPTVWLIQTSRKCTFNMKNLSLSLSLSATENVEQSLDVLWLDVWWKFVGIFQKPD